MAEVDEESFDELLELSSGHVIDCVSSPMGFHKEDLFNDFVMAPLGEGVCHVSEVTTGVMKATGFEEIVEVILGFFMVAAVEGDIEPHDFF